MQAFEQGSCYPVYCLSGFCGYVSISYKLMFILLTKTSSDLRMSLCRNTTKTTEVLLKECSAYRQIDQGGGEREEPLVYEHPLCTTVYITIAHIRTVIILYIPTTVIIKIFPSTYTVTLTPQIACLVTVSHFDFGCCFNSTGNYCGC